MRIAFAGLAARAVMIATSANAQSSNDDSHSVFAASICNSLEMNYGSDQASDVLRSLFAEHLSIAATSPSFANAAQSFWAQHDDEIICENASLVKPYIRTPQAFLKRVVDMNMEGQIFNGWLLDSDYPIDVNAVQWVDGEPETLLDYLNLIIADDGRHAHYSMNEIMRLRHHLITNFGAMTAEELGF